MNYYCFSCVAGDCIKYVYVTSAHSLFSAVTNVRFYCSHFSFPANITMPSENPPSCSSLKLHGLSFWSICFLFLFPLYNFCPSGGWRTHCAVWPVLSNPHKDKTLTSSGNNCLGKCVESLIRSLKLRSHCGLLMYCRRPDAELLRLCHNV